MGVVANAKHFVLNNQETDRNSIDVQVDERTLHELYLPPFEGAIEGGVEFNSDLFLRESVVRLAARLAVVAAAFEAKGDVWAAPLMPSDEAQRVLWRFNDTAAAFPSEVCVHELVGA